MLYEKKPAGIQKEYKSNMGYFCHLHPHIELVFVMSGRAVCKIDGQETIADTDDAILIFPYQRHEYPFGQNEQGQFAQLVIPPEVYKPYQRFISAHLPVTGIIPGFARHKELNELLSIIIAAENKGLPYEMCQGFTVGILGAALQTAELTQRSATQNDSLPLTILDYCSEHFAEEISLDRIADQFYISRSYISRIFSNTLGISFTDFLGYLRVGEAAERLQTTCQSITEIAYSVGFNSVRSFNRAFYKCYNTTPREFRSKPLQLS